MVTSLPEVERRMVEGYALVRRTLEHHKALPASDVYLSVYVIRLRTESGEDIEDLPHSMQAGERLQVGISEKGHTLPAGQEVTLSEDELSDIASTLLFWIAPHLLKGLAAKTPQPDAVS